MDERDLLETRIRSEIVYRGGYLTLRLDTIEDARGQRQQREVIEHPGAVAIVAIDRGAVLFVRQFRTAVGRLCLEIPAGTLDRAPDGLREDPMAAAPRELGEETGFRAGSWRRLGHFFTAPGFADEDMHLFLATDLTAIPDYTGPETDERIQLSRVPWTDALAMADGGEFDDAKTMLALYCVDRVARREGWDPTAS